MVIGAMMMWPLVGVDPIPGRISYPFRLLVMFLMLPFHAFLGISIMSANRLIAEDWYLAFERAWPPSPLEDQYLGGAIMWASGDVTALIMLAALFVQWFAHSQREARREDRRLDRLEERAALIARGDDPPRTPRKAASVARGDDPPRTPRKDSERYDRSATVPTAGQRGETDE